MSFAEMGWDRSHLWTQANKPHKTTPLMRVPPPPAVPPSTAGKLDADFVAVSFSSSIPRTKIMPIYSAGFTLERVCCRGEVFDAALIPFPGPFNSLCSYQTLLPPKRGLDLCNQHRAHQRRARAGHTTHADLAWHASLHGTVAARCCARLIYIYIYIYIYILFVDRLRITIPLITNFLTTRDFLSLLEWTSY